MAQKNHTNEVKMVCFAHFASSYCDVCACCCIIDEACEIRVCMSEPKLIFIHRQSTIKHHSSSDSNNSSSSTSKTYKFISCSFVRKTRCNHKIKRKTKKKQTKTTAQTHSDQKIYEISVQAAQTTRISCSRQSQ